MGFCDGIALHSRGRGKLIPQKPLQISNNDAMFIKLRKFVQY